MNVILFKSRFWEPVVAGKKLHTIRAGDQLSLRGWEGKAYRSPQRLLDSPALPLVRIGDHGTITFTAGGPTGGPEVNGERSEVLLARGANRGIFPNQNVVG